MGKPTLVLVMIFLSSLSAADTSDDRIPITDFTIRAVDLIENENEIKIFHPHVVINERTHRFAGNRPTYEGLCHLVLNGHDIIEAEPGFSSNGTAFLNPTGEIIRLGSISRSFKSIKCLK